MARLSITDLKAQVVGAGYYSRANRYYVEFQPPAALLAGTQPSGIKWANNAVKKIGLNCKAIDFPGSNVATQEVPRPADVRKAAYTRLFPDISSQFYVSDNLPEVQFFNDWQDLAIHPRTGQVGYFEHYTGQFSLHMLNLQQSTTYTLAISQCFPTAIGTMTMDYSSNDQLNVLPVTWVWRSNHDASDAGQKTPSAENVLGTVVRQLDRQVLNKFENILRQSTNGLIDISEARNRANVIGGLGGFI